jgi:hypothetical protein
MDSESHQSLMAHQTTADSFAVVDQARNDSITITSFTQVAHVANSHSAKVNSIRPAALS